MEFPLPDVIDGGVLERDLASAGYQDVSVHVSGDRLIVNAADLDESSRDEVKNIIDAHVPDPPARDPQEDLRQAISAASNLQQLKDALLGKDRSAQVAGRPK